MCEVYADEQNGASRMMRRQRALHIDQDPGKKQVQGSSGSVRLQKFPSEPSWLESI
jgi:hypothetical protein